MTTPFLNTPPTSQQFYINGDWQSPAYPATLPVVNPATEQVIAEVARGSGEDVDRAVAAARAAFPDWSATSVQARVAILGKIHALILERKEELAQVLSLEMGAAIGFARAMASAAGRRTRSGGPRCAVHLQLPED